MIKAKTLDCGVRIVMEEIPHVKSIAMGIFVKAGSRGEEEKYAGISHFIEHMMFKGTEKRSAKQLAEDADKIAGNSNAFTSKESTCYHIKTLSSNADKAAEILLDMFLNSKFAPADIAREREVIFEEMSMIEDTPDDLAYEIATENVFKGNPLAKPVIGTRSSLRNVSRRAMKDYIAREYTKDSIVIAVAGNFDEEHICSLFDHSGLAKLPASKPAILHEPQPHAPSYTVRVKNIEQSHLILAARSLSLDDDDFYALALLNNIMGGSMSSRLFQNIREQKGLAYSVYSLMSTYTDMGCFCIYAGVGHTKIKQALSAIRSEIDVLAKDGVTAEELSMAKEQLKGGYIYGQESVNHRMLSIGKNMLLLDKIYTAEDVIGGIDKVSLEDIERVSSLLCDINNYSCALVSNRRVNLKKYVLG